MEGSWSPHAIRVTKGGTVYVADQENRRVQMFTTAPDVREAIRADYRRIAEARIQGDVTAAIGGGSK